jgi:Sulfotransferase family
MTGSAETHPAVELPSPLDEFRQLSKMRLAHLVEVSQPLVLISQIQRSGGTLLSQLFDGHPECHAHPGEIHIGWPRKHYWPPLDTTRPESWFEVLFEPPVLDYLRRGYRKPSTTRLDHDVFPFLFSPGLQRAIFEDRVGAAPAARVRDVLDYYYTSYFNAWLDNHNLYTGPKKVVTGFAARLSERLGNLEHFYDAYPDGTLVSIVRDPRAWYASALKYRWRYADLDESLGRWRRSTTAAIQAFERWGDHVILLTYDDLVLETEATMRRLAERIGISMSPVLLAPTFNGRPIRANSSEAVLRFGIVPERVSAYREVLDDDAVSRIDDLAGDLYRRAAELSREQAG